MSIACVLMSVAPAFAASMAAHDDCDADNNPDRNIAGCTLIIEDASEGHTMQAVAHVARGLAWQAKGDLDRALADYTEAIRLNPRDALAYNNRGLLWRETGDVDRAIADLTDAIRIDPLPFPILPVAVMSISTPTAASPGRARAISVAPSPTSIKPSNSIETTPTP